MMNTSILNKNCFKSVEINTTNGQKIVLLFQAYVLPNLLLLSLLNNFIVFELIISSKRICTTLPPTIRFNFLVNSINDISYLFPTHLSSFLGVYFLGEIFLSFGVYTLYSFGHFILKTQRGPTANKC